MHYSFLYFLVYIPQLELVNDKLELYSTPTSMWPAGSALQNARMHNWIIVE